MKRLILHSTLSAIFTATLASLVLSPAHAAPGTLSRAPLFIAAKVPPNIFFMLDDSGSMNWGMPTDGVGSRTIVELYYYTTIPSTGIQWRMWCKGANLLAYDANTTYKPWPANLPGTSTPFANQTDLTRVQTNPRYPGSLYSSENLIIGGGANATVNLSAAPVIEWTDNDGDGQYSASECATSYSDSRVKRADDPSFTAAERINFANWFAYYRTRQHATKSAITEIASTSSARMGVATLHGNNGVGLPIKDMSVTINKTNFLNDIVSFRSSGGTPLRRSLNNVGLYFDKASSTPSQLRIGSPPSPILPVSQGGECQQNFAMLMTDGSWNGSNTGVGDQDANAANPYVYPAHRDNPVTQGDTLADVAMKWYSKDLAPLLTAKVPIQTGADESNLDENSEQHLVTFGVAFGPNGTVTSDPTDRNDTSFVWPIPNTSQRRVDDLRHASYNGRGQFLSASDTESLALALQNVLSDIDSRQGSASAVSFDKGQVSSGTDIFTASFDTTKWSGNLKSVNINESQGKFTTPNWEAAEKLDNRTNISTRRIYTWGTDSTNTPNGVLFKWRTSNPQSAEMINDLKKNPGSGSDTSPYSQSKGRLNFLRGDRSQEATGLIRERDSRLGDIINSAPSFVGIPQSNWPNTSSFGSAVKTYSAFQAGLTSSPRAEMVYVGANDGMLHGFRASDGEELVAYMPSSPISNSNSNGYHKLTESGYGHQYYVDGSPVTTDVYIKTEPTGSTDWRTVLIGGLRGGGRGYYALDVTDPSAFSNSQTAAAKTVLWEFTNQHDNDLGFSYSTPQITMMNNNKWAVIFGNGYNAAGTDKAKLFILFIEKGIDGSWTLGTDYLKLDTNAGTVTNKNGLSSPTLLDIDGNGTTDRVYAGDLLGNMWAFDLSNNSSSNWSIANSGSPLFAAGTTKPITTKPTIKKSVGILDTTLNAPNYMVYFGTGQYLAVGDASNTASQSFYGILDSGSSVSSSNLVEQILSSDTVAKTRTLSTNTVNYESTDKGWFINLPLSGERMVVDSSIKDGNIRFNVQIPKSSPCSSGGFSYQLAADAMTGTQPTTRLFDTNNDGVVDLNDEIVAGKEFNGLLSTTVFYNGWSITGTTDNTNNNSGAAGLLLGPPPYIVPPVATVKLKSWIQLIKQP